MKPSDKLSPNTRMVFVSAAGACSAKTRDIMARNAATAHIIQKYTTSWAAVGQPLRLPGLGRRSARPTAVPSELDVEGFPRNGLTLQPSNFFLWLILLSTVSGASGATSFAPCHKNRWSVFWR